MAQVFDQKGFRKTDRLSIDLVYIHTVTFYFLICIEMKCMQNFNVILLPCGTKIGEISRIAGFLERPKYEINDAQDGPLFNLVLDSRTNLLRNPNYVNFTNMHLSRV